MSFVRRMEPEWLDELPAEDPRAARSRRDLKRINVVMLQKRIMTQLLRSACSKAPRRLVELGGGDGTFLLGVARGLASRWPGVKAVLVDRQNIVTAPTRSAFARLGWELEVAQTDVFDFLRHAPQRADAILANLFLHHFSADDLARLFALASRLGDAFVACEPRRSSPSLLGARLLFALGANDVTRHDAVASVRAGFSGQELSQLWPATAGWVLAERAVLPFTHGFSARREAHAV